MPGTRKQPKRSSRAAQRDTAKVSSPRSAQRKREADATQDQPSFGRLERINISGLLGQFSHEIELPEGGPSILTGANGTGKSTLLRLINAVGGGDWMTLAALPFERVDLHFDSSETVEIHLKNDQLRLTDGHGQATIDLSDAPARITPARLSRMSPTERRRYREWVTQRSRLAHGYDPDLVSDTGVFLEAKTWRVLADQAMFYGEQLRLLDDPDREVIQRIADRFRVRFITDQRLIIRGDDLDPSRPTREPGASERSGREQVADRVTHYSQKLGRQITVALGEYANVSQREDRGFPQRVAQELTRDRSVAADELRPLMNEVAERRLALEGVGLAEAVPGPSFDSSGNLEDASVRIVFKTFAEATLRKFSVLEEFRVDLDLFISFLNQRFVGKAARPRSDTGLTFVLDDGRELEPSQLSSGEQQLVVLAYEVLFETQPNTLLLIDEPEISLHVLWQSTFVDDIAEMGRPRNLSFLLATHSPTLIGGRRELMRSLDPQ